MTSSIKAHEFLVSSADDWLPDDHSVCINYMRQVAWLSRTRQGKSTAMLLWVLASPGQRQTMLLTIMPEVSALSTESLGSRLVIAMLTSAEGASVLQRLIDEGPLDRFVPSPHGRIVLQHCMIWHYQNAEVKALCEACLYEAAFSLDWRQLALAALKHKCIPWTSLAKAAGDAEVLYHLIRGDDESADIFRKAMHRTLEYSTQVQPSKQHPPCLFYAVPGYNWHNLEPAVMQPESANETNKQGALKSMTLNTLVWRFKAKDLQQSLTLPLSPQEVEGRTYRLCCLEPLPYEKNMSKHGTFKVLLQLRCDDGGEALLTRGPNTRRHCFSLHHNAMFRAVLHPMRPTFVIGIRNL